MSFFSKSTTKCFQTKPEQMVTRYRSKHHLKIQSFFFVTIDRLSLHFIISASVSSSFRGRDGGGSWS